MVDNLISLHNHLREQLRITISTYKLATDNVWSPIPPFNVSRLRIGPRPGQYPGPDGSLALEAHRRLERGSTPEFSSPARQSTSQP